MRVKPVYLEIQVIPLAPQKLGGGVSEEGWKRMGRRE
jgi:hypothetical protein